MIESIQHIFVFSVKSKTDNDTVDEMHLIIATDPDSVDEIDASLVTIIVHHHLCITECLHAFNFTHFLMRSTSINVEVISTRMWLQLIINFINLII